jgi:hypothetical protein
MSWNPAAALSDTENGNYVAAGIIPRAEQHVYKETAF